MRLFLFLFIILSFETYGSTHACKNLKDKNIKIGCTFNNCGFFNRFAISNHASKHNLDISFHALDSQKKSLSELDGVVIPGGADINPNYYSSLLSEEKKKHITLAKLTEEGKKRDPFELGLLDEYFQAPSPPPLLGICRGMQALAVSQNLPLYIDIKEQLKIPNRIYTVDKIQTRRPSSLFKGNDFKALELHHQALDYDYYKKHKDKFSHFDITATSHQDMIPEVIEFKSHPVLGVQFHPEMTLAGKARSKTFNWFIEQICIHKNKKEKL